LDTVLSWQPTVTKLVEDRAEQLKREPDKVAQELETTLFLQPILNSTALHSQGGERLRVTEA